MPMNHEPHPGLRWRRLIWETEPRLTQQQVATRARTSEKHLSQILNGKALPSAALVRRFAAVVDTDATVLWSEVAAYKLHASHRDGHHDD